MARRSRIPGDNWTADSDIESLLTGWFCARTVPSARDGSKNFSSSNSAGTPMPAWYLRGARMSWAERFFGRTLTVGTHLLESLSSSGGAEGHHRLWSTEFYTRLPFARLSGSSLRNNMVPDGSQTDEVWLLCLMVAVWSGGRGWRNWVYSSVG